MWKMLSVLANRKVTNLERLSIQPQHKFLSGSRRIYHKKIDERIDLPLSILKNIVGR